MGAWPDALNSAKRLRGAEGITGASDALITALAVSKALNTLVAHARKAKCSA